MAHVTFIHGIANKPEKDALLDIWERGVRNGQAPIHLADEGVRTSMVYWADVLYETPIIDAPGFESLLESVAEVVDPGDESEIPAPSTPDERATLEALRHKFTVLEDVEIDAALDEDTANPDGMLLERVPLPWFVKKQFLKAFLRDAYYGLFDHEFSPRPGETFRVRSELRRRFVESLSAVGDTVPHIVVSHSWGTFVAYDCLKNVPECPAIDHLITLGSPLGLDEIQDNLIPSWTRSDGFPKEKVRGSWANIYDPLDPVCGFDPVLANDFQRGGNAIVRDIEVANGGRWRHSITKYLYRREFGQTLADVLGL